MKLVSVVGEVKHKQKHNCFSVGVNNNYMKVASKISDILRGVILVNDINNEVLK